MAAHVAELDGHLQTMSEAKPPGVSGPKIKTITELCTTHIEVCADYQILIYMAYADMFSG